MKVKGTVVEKNIRGNSVAGLTKEHGTVICIDHIIATDASGHKRKLSARKIVVK